MGLATRLKRSTKVLLGLDPWPRREDSLPRSFEEQLYAAVVRPGDVCFDVGANRGDVSLFLARLAGESGRVISFEPVWPVYAELCKRVQLDTALKAAIVTVPLGMAHAETDATVHVPNDEFGMGSMADPDAWAKAQKGATIGSFRVRLSTLDAFLAVTALPPPTFMKVDVEGAELFVLRGASGLFSAGRRPLLLIEVFAPWEAAFGYQPWEPLSWLLARGYRFLFACPGGLVEHSPTQADPFPKEYEMGYNVLAYVPGTHDDRIAAVSPLRAGHGAPLLPMPPPPRPNRAQG